MADPAGTPESAVQEPTVEHNAARDDLIDPDGGEVVHPFGRSEPALGQGEGPTDVVGRHRDPQMLRESGRQFGCRGGGVGRGSDERRSDPDAHPDADGVLQPIEFDR